MKLLQRLFSKEVHGHVDGLSLNLLVASSALNRNKLSEGSFDVLSGPSEAQVIKTILEMSQSQVLISHAVNASKILSNCSCTNEASFLELLNVLIGDAWQSSERCQIVGILHRLCAIFTELVKASERGVALCSWA